jgi:hypothetical protein
MTHEQSNRHEIITSPEGYYNDSRVIHSVLSFLGGKGKSWNDINSISSEFLGIGTREKLASGKASPVSTIRPEWIKGWLDKTNGYAEIYSSFLQKDRESLPSRVLLLWDIERYGDKGWIYYNQQEVFETLEPVYQVYKRQLGNFGIPFISVATGQGWHIVTSVTRPDIIHKLMDIGGVVEPSVLGKHQHIPQDSKRNHLIGSNHELAYKGAVRLQQFMNMNLIEEARRESGRHNLQVEIWDKGWGGIALDNTSATGTVDTRNSGALGSLYFLKPTKHGVWLDRIIIRIPREGTGFSVGLNEILSRRNSYGKAAELLGGVDCRIPDASGSFDRLIGNYNQSKLKRLHEVMDASSGDDPLEYDHTYRLNNYEAVISQTKEPDSVRGIIRSANDSILEPENMDKIVWQLFEAFGGSADNPAPAPHVAGCIRAILEDPQFNWGGRWTRHYDAARYANGAVTEILGQGFI